MCVCVCVCVCARVCVRVCAYSVHVCWPSVWHRYAPKFEGAGLATRASVLAKPLLDDLSDLGVTKAGHNRYLLALFKRLAGGDDDDDDADDDDDDDEDADLTADGVDEEEGAKKKKKKKKKKKTTKKIEDDGLARVGSEVVLRKSGMSGVRGIVRAFRGPKPAFGRSDKKPADPASTDKPPATDGLFEVEITTWQLANGNRPMVFCAESAFDVVAQADDNNAPEGEENEVSQQQQQPRPLPTLPRKEEGRRAELPKPTLARNS